MPTNFLKQLISCFQSDQNTGNLKEELRAIVPQLEEMRKRKCDRRNQFLEALEQIHKISTEIYTPLENKLVKTVLDESDLSLKKLDELHRQLQALQKEKVFSIYRLLSPLGLALK